MNEKGHRGCARGRGGASVADKSVSSVKQRFNVGDLAELLRGVARPPNRQRVEAIDAG